MTDSFSEERSLRFAIGAMAMTALLVMLVPDVHAQTYSDYNEFYRTLRYTALDHFMMCEPIDSVRKAPVAYGVRRDSLGRPTLFTRFFFGNPDTRAEWTTMKIEYTPAGSSGNVMERRTFYGGGMIPTAIGWAYGEEVLRRRDGTPIMRRPIDLQGEPPGRVNMIGRTMYKPDGERTYMQEWFYSNGRQHYGMQTDGPLRPFGHMTDKAYFRRFEVDERGNLLREELWSIEKKNTPFAGGELVRSYELDDCGRAVKVEFLDLEGNAMADSTGIASETLRYDEFGRILEWQAFGLDGEPHARPFDKAARIVYTYRQFDGVLLHEEKFGADGRPMQ